MSELFKEAILDAKKIKEIAEIEAKNRVLEALAPHIKKAITEEVSGIAKEDFLFKEDEPVDAVSTLGQETSSLPITPVGGNILDLPMPDQEGKITVDFGQLFQMGTKQNEMSETPSVEAIPEVAPMQVAPEAVPAEPAPIAPEQPVAPTGTPAEAGNPPAEGVQPQQPQTPPGQNLQNQAPQQPVNPEEQLTPPIGESVEAFKSDVAIVAERIGYLHFRKVPAIVKESVKTKLFNLCEALDKLEEKCLITPKQARLAEGKLDFLYKKLEEAAEVNIYESVSEGNTMSKQLEEFAAKLFEQDELGPATVDQAAAHAHEKSGVKKDVDLMKEDLLEEDAPASSAFGDGEKAKGAETASKDVHSASALADEKGDNNILESAPASSAFGDGEKAQNAQTASKAVHNPDALADKDGDNMILEVNDEELKEELRKIRKENLVKKLKALSENAKLTKKDADKKDTPLEDGEPLETESEAHKTADVNNPKAKKPMTECMMQEDEGFGGLDDLGQEDSFGAEEEVELTFKVNLKDLEALLADVESDGSASVDLDLDSAAPDAGMDMDMGSEEEEIEIVDDEASFAGPEEKEEEKDEELLMDKEDKSINESKQVSQIKKQLVESQLFAAKALYLNKFSIREDLSRKQKHKIAKYLDGAKTLDEAKDVYNKVKRILDEAVTTKTGSSAKPVTSGGSTVIKESVDTAGNDLASRWAHLAGIDKKTKR